MHRAASDTASHRSVQPGPGPHGRFVRTAPARPIPPDVARLLRRLPALQLQLTEIFQPRLLETIARAWTQPAMLRRTLDGLIFDARCNRAGFPPEVVLELGELRLHYDLRVVPRPIDGR